MHESTSELPSDDNTHLWNISVYLTRQHSLNVNLSTCARWLLAVQAFLIAIQSRPRVLRQACSLPVPSPPYKMSHSSGKGRRWLYCEFLKEVGMRLKM